MHHPHTHIHRRYTKYDKLEYVEDSFHIMHQKLPDYMDEYNHLLANVRKSF